MNPEASLHAAPLFRDIPTEIKKYAVVKHPWDKTKDTPVFTGIPPHVLHLAEMEGLRNEIVALRANLKSDMVALMNERGFASASFNTEQLITAITQKQSEAFDSLFEKIQFSIDLQQDNNNVNEVGKYCFDEEVVETSLDNIKDLTKSEQTQKTNEYNQQVSQIMKKRKFTVGLQDGKLTPLPPNFTFPSMNVEQLTYNWILGNVESNVPPYSTLSRHYLKHNKSEQAKLGMMRTLMRYVECIARKHGVWEKKSSDWTYEKVNNMWKKIGLKYIIEPFSKNSNRHKSLRWKSFYNKMSSYNVFNNKNNKGFTQGLITEYSHDTKNIEEVKESNESETKNDDEELFLPSPTHYLNPTGRRCNLAPRRRRTVSRTTTTLAVAARNSSVGANVLNIVNPVANYRHVSRTLVQHQQKREQLINFKLNQQ